MDTSLAMTYEQAHNILHDKDPEGSNYTPPPSLTAGGPVDRGSISDLKKDLTILTNLQRKLRKRRETVGGAVDLSSGERGSELKFVLDKNGNPTKVMAKKELEIHHTIAELMIMANSFVAETIYKRFPDSALLRIHGPAKTENFDEMESLLKASGANFDGKSNKALAQSLNEAKARGAGSLEDSLFQSLATRAMTEAQYVCTGAYGDTGLSHYGLGIGLYTHFTSPIRRYADVIVHRLLIESLTERQTSPTYSLSIPSSDGVEGLIPESNAISILNGEGIKSRNNHIDPGELDDDDFLDSLIEGAEELALGPSSEESQQDINTAEQNGDVNAIVAKDPYQTTELSKTCDVLNSQNRIAKRSSMECQRLFLSLYFRENIEVTQAVIIGLRQNGLIVYVPKFDMQGPVFLADRERNVQVDPHLFGLSSTSGQPASPGFALLEGCRMFPDGRCTLEDEDEELKARVVLQLSGSKTLLSFRRLDVITVQLSCDLSDTVARVPPPRLHLVSLDQNHSIAGKKRLNKLAVKLVRNIEDSRERQVDPAVLPSRKEDEFRSIFNVLSSIPINADLNDTPLRFVATKRNTSKAKERVQTIKGRIYLNGFKAEELKSANGQVTTSYTHTSQVSLADQARSGDFDAARQIEREATARMQRIAAANRNMKKSKATKRK